MRKNVGKVISYFLVTIILLSGCGKTTIENETPATDSQTAVESEVETDEIEKEFIQPLGKYDSLIEVHTVKSVDSDVTVETLSDNIWEDMYRDEFNINLVYDWVATADQYEQKVNLMMSNGDIPDVMQVNYKQLSMMVESNMLADLTEVWNTTATDVSKESMQKACPEAFEMATFDGKLYGIPVTVPVDETAQVLWIRTDWLKKLELDMPINMEELMLVMEAFVTQDPDGNGVKDTYAMTVSKDLYSPVHGITSFANSYHAYPDAWNETVDGKLEYGSIQPAMKIVLEELSKLYQKGMIDPEFIVKDMTLVAETVAADKVGICYGMQWAPFIGMGALWENNQEADFQAISLLPSDDGKVFVQSYNNSSQFLVVNQKYEHPDVAAQFFNIWNRHLRGPWDINYDDWYKYQEVLFKGSLVTPETGHWNGERWELIHQVWETGDTSLVEGKHLVTELFSRLDNFKKGDLEKEFDVPGCAMLFNCGEAFDVIGNEYKAKDMLITDKLGSYSSDNYISKISILEQLELETFTRIITGDAPIDEFDKYVEQWKELGGEEITAEINGWYSSSN